jgi:acetolactate decarboxylase
MELNRMQTPRNVEGSLAIVPALVAHQSTPESTARPGELYQFSLMNALAEGVYEGSVTYGAVRQHGDFGLGTFNELDGEMVGFDGQFYQLRSDGSARLVDPEQKTPFAIVTFFQPTLTREVKGPMTKVELQKWIESLTEGNYFQAIKVDGQFAKMTTRTVSRQRKPYPKLSEAASGQQTLELTNVAGTLAGFRSPGYARGIGVSGFHLHFLKEDRQGGGHALDYVLTEGCLSIASELNLHIELPQTGEFEQANLDNPGDIEAIAKVEG